jgi:hypothetical protein
MAAARQKKTPGKKQKSDQTPNKPTKSFSSPLSKRWLRESAPKELDGKATAKAKAKSKAKAKAKTNRVMMAITPKRLTKCMKTKMTTAKKEGTSCVLLTQNGNRGRTRLT